MAGYFSNLMQTSGLLIRNRDRGNMSMERASPGKRAAQKSVESEHLETSEFIEPSLPEKSIEKSTFEHRSFLAPEEKMPPSEPDIKTYEEISHKYKFPKETLRDKYIPDDQKELTSSEIPVSEPDYKTQERMTPSEVRRTYLKKVREWVAVTPEQYSQSEANMSFDETPKKVDRQSSYSPPYPGEAHIVASAPWVKPYRVKEPEIQNFQLSIGTIEVNVEEPSAIDYPQPSPRRITEQQATQSGISSSRLSRHYIKLR